MYVSSATVKRRQCGLVSFSLLLLHFTVFTNGYWGNTTQCTAQTSTTRTLATDCLATPLQHRISLPTTLLIPPLYLLLTACYNVTLIYCIMASASPGQVQVQLTVWKDFSKTTRYMSHGILYSLTHTHNQFHTRQLMHNYWQQATSDIDNNRCINILRSISGLSVDWGTHTERLSTHTAITWLLRPDLLSANNNFLWLLCYEYRNAIVIREQKKYKYAVTANNKTP